MAAEEVIIEQWVLRLDGNVVELLHSTGLAFRYHVNHVAVEAKQRDDGLSLRIGVDVKGKIVEGAKLKVPAARQAEVEALFEQARERRIAAGGVPRDSESGRALDD